MHSDLHLIKALATTLISEIDSLGFDDREIFTDERFSLPERVRDFEVKLIKMALKKTGGNQRRAANLLGIKTTTLHNKIRLNKISPSELD